MLGKALLVAGLTSPGVILSILTNWVWEWGIQYTAFTLGFIYCVIYFLYWFITDFWDNC